MQNNRSTKIINFIKNKPNKGWILNAEKGFSLVELLVIVSIISVVSMASVSGFGRARQMLQFRESVSVFQEVIQQEELKVLRGDFKRVVIHFLEDYLVIEEHPAHSSLELNLTDCLPYNPPVAYGVSLGAHSGLLVQSGPEGVIQTRNLKKGKVDCQTDFKKSRFTEINYQLSYLNEVSPHIRFVHFNLKRDPIDSFIYIGAGAGSKMEIHAPYSKKLVYNHQNELMSKGSIIEVKDRSGSFSEKLTLK